MIQKYSAKNYKTQLLDLIVNDPAYVVNNAYDYRYIYINFNKKLTVQMIVQVKSILDKS